MSHAAANPEMLVLGRDSRGMTQADLARKSGVSQGYISKGENELLPVAGERLDAIARALDYPVDFFVLPEHAEGVEALFHRKLRTLPAAQLRQVQAQINIMRVQVKRLMRGVEIRAPRPFPRFDVDEVGGPEEAARLTRRAWRLPLGPIVNLVRSIEAAGGVVIPVSFATAKVSAAAQWPVDDSRPYFFVNAGHPGDRQRFSLAHEVAHVVLHSFPDPEQEAQADRFAAELLMPADEIRPQLRPKLTPSRLIELKRYWKVAMSAIIMRAGQLETISEKEKTSLYKLMGARGWRTREPYILRAEAPELLPSVLATHINQHGYSIGDLSRVALVREAEFRRLYGVQDNEPPGGGPSHLRVVA